MENQGIEQVEPVILDNGARVRLNYTGSFVLLPVSDYNAIIDNYESRIDECIEEAEQAPEMLREVWKANNCRNKRKGTGLKGDAEILAMAMSGVKVKDILKCRFTYDKFGHKRVFNERKVYKALSVNKSDDYQRIKDLFEAYQDVFLGITEQQVDDWYWKKYNKWNKGGS